ncbi:MAG: hypothetical protein ACK4KT_10035, partial [Thermaurantimonas sp.]
FILSQDQTLRCNSFSLSTYLPLCLLLTCIFKELLLYSLSLRKIGLQRYYVFSLAQLPAGVFANFLEL